MTHQPAPRRLIPAESSSTGIRKRRDASSRPAADIEDLVASSNSEGRDGTLVLIPSLPRHDEGDEAPEHPHNKERRTYVEIDGITQPAPAPRFSRTVPDLPIPPQPPGGLEEAESILADWLEPAEIAALRAAATIGPAR